MVRLTPNTDQSFEVASVTPPQPEGVQRLCVDNPGPVSGSGTVVYNGVGLPRLLCSLPQAAVDASRQ